MGFIIFILIIVITSIYITKQSEIQNLNQQIKGLQHTHQIILQSVRKLSETLQPITQKPQLFMDNLYEKCLKEIMENSYQFLDKREEAINLWTNIQAPRLPKSFVEYVDKYKTNYHKNEAINKINDYLRTHSETREQQNMDPTNLTGFVEREHEKICQLFFNFYHHLLRIYDQTHKIYTENQDQIKWLSTQKKLLEQDRKKFKFDRITTIESIKKQQEELKTQRQINLEEIENYRLKCINEINQSWEDFKNNIDLSFGQLESLKKEFSDILSKTLTQTGETYSQLNAEIDTDYLDRFAQYFREKKHSALNSSQIVAELKREQKQKVKNLRKYEYIINAYERMFPWLTEFLEYPMEAVLKLNANEQEEDEIFTHYLSPKERESLTKTEKFQRVLDRYEDSYDKTNWQIGLFYERYIGYTYDIQQWKVIMNGAKKRWQDMGIDIIASKSGKTELIQCKYWAANKTIYENYIFQLFGTAIDYIMEHFATEDPWEILRKRIVVPVFITSTQVSDTARRVAKILKIDLRENIKLDKKYPKIKCNPNSPDGKIFHLPFDQQYDNFQLGNNPNAFYIKTVAEAEKLGFRRAYRWHPTD